MILGCLKISPHIGSVKLRILIYQILNNLLVCRKGRSFRLGGFGHQADFLGLHIEGMATALHATIIL